MASKKKYIITSLTLGAIAAASAALIGVTNLVTYKQIQINEQNKINKGIASIFGDGVTVKEEADLNTYKYVNHYYSLDEGKMAFRTSGSNMYGKITLLVGFNNNKFVKLYVITNEQTYASTLVDNYIVPLNEGKRDAEDVSCGATYGAKLVRDMVNEAKATASEFWSK